MENGRSCVGQERKRRGKGQLDDEDVARLPHFPQRSRGGQDAVEPLADAGHPGKCGEPRLRHSQAMLIQRAPSRSHAEREAQPGCLDVELVDQAAEPDVGVERPRVPRCKARADEPESQGRPTGYDSRWYERYQSTNRWTPTSMGVRGMKPVAAVIASMSA